MDLEDKAKQIRRDVLETIVRAGRGHIAGSLSSVDILVSLYHTPLLRYKANNPSWEYRDRFILSKGHACAALYSVLADVGFYPKARLETFHTESSPFEGHANMAVPGVEVNSGSLGHGLGIGNGLAFAGKYYNQDYKVVVLMGDGECHEGTVWESAMFTAHHKLDNVIGIVDYNNQCVLDKVSDCNDVYPLPDKWRAFGWQVIEANGHCIPEIQLAYHKALQAKGRPVVIIAHTIKGKGVSFMERNVIWHHKVPKDKELEIARAELS